MRTFVTLSNSKPFYLTSLSYGGGGERGIKECRCGNVNDASETSSETDDSGGKFSRKPTWSGVELGIESVLLRREFRVRSSVSLLVRRKSILRILLHLEVPSVVVFPDGLSPSIDPGSVHIYVRRLVKCLSSWLLHTCRWSHYFIQWCRLR